MKKIGLLIDTMNGGGAQRVVSHLSGILASVYDVTVILFDDSNIQYECAAPIYSLNVPAQGGSVFTKISLLRKRVKRLKSYIKSEGIECVVSFLDSPNFVNLFAKVKGCRKLISIRNYSGLENKRSRLGRLTDFAMKRLYRKADCVVTVSKLLEKDFMQHYHIPSEKIATVYNPYNFDDIKEKSALALSDTEKAFCDGGFVFTNVGRIMHQKAVWHLVKALYLVREEYPEARLAVVGDDFTKGKLAALVEALGMSDAILLPGRSQNPYKYLANSQCYVLSSLFEGFPNAMVEAMACKIPIIATDCKSGPREILFEKLDLEREINDVTLADYGILVPNLEDEENWTSTVFTDGEKKLASAMKMIMENASLARELSEKSSERSRDFDFERCRKAFAELIG